MKDKVKGKLEELILMKLEDTKLLLQMPGQDTAPGLGPVAFER